MTLEQLCKIMPHLKRAKAELYLPLLNKALEEAGINTPLREAHFISQAAHESFEFLYFQEIYGPTEQQKKYEPPSALATRLGNTQPGDGLRFKGRGIFQLTGRANYNKYGALLDLPLETNPALAADPEISFKIACKYWNLNHLSDFADKDDILTITKRINGGTNGLDSRKKYLALAKEALGA